MTTIAPPATAGVVSATGEPVHTYAREVRDTSVLENAFPPMYEDIGRFVGFFDDRCRTTSFVAWPPFLIRYGVLGAMPRRGSSS
jgi:hypothetical protein